MCVLLIPGPSEFLMSLAYLSIYRDTPSGLKVVTGEHNEAVNTGREIDHAVEKIIMVR